MCSIYLQLNITMCSMKRSLLLLSFLLFNSIFLFAQDSTTTVHWLKFPAISPDGQTIAFGYMGDLYTVSAGGGIAKPLTTGGAHYERPIWSHDGQTIAYSSDRYGNFDVYTMPAQGGESTRITYHSADDYALDFTPDDANVLVSSNREAPATNVRFPGVAYFPNLYNIPVDGGRPDLVTAVGADRARYNKEGAKIIFQNKKGYEDYYRKHHTSAITRDIWIYDLENDSYDQVSSFEGENRVPHFSGDENSMLYTNGESGDLNVYKRSLNGRNEEQLTDFKDFPVRSLSTSDNDKMAFSWKGDIYTLREGNDPKKLDIQVHNNAGYNTIKDKEIKSVSGFSVSSNGKEIAFVNRGEVFVTGVDNKHTKRITNTPEQERMVEWSPDSKTLVFAGERDGIWNIYKTTLKHSDEKFFYSATTLETEELVATDKNEFQPKFSPDGKKIAYVENRNILKVMDLDSGNKTTVLPEGRNHSYSDGDWDFEWSPDSRWLLVDDQKGYFDKSNTALISADGEKDIIHPVNGGFGESDAKWALDGKMMTYKSTKEGRKSLAYQGSHEEDVYGVFFDQEAYDNYKLSEDEYKLKKAREDDDEDKDDEEKDDDNKKEDKDKEPLDLDLDNLDKRKIKLTINSASISDYVLNEDGSKLYYLASFEKGYDVWVTEPRTHETKILTKLSGSPSGMEISDDGKTLFLSNHGHLVKVDTDEGDKEKIKIDSDMELNRKAERQYIFNHTWQQVKDKFYDPDLHGIDWDNYHKAYGKFLPYINNNYDFQILLSEFLGELNASHTGGRYSPDHDNADHTASLGALYDQNYQGEGIKITEVLKGGPLNKAKSTIEKGDIIKKINDHTIDEGENWNKYLKNRKGKHTLLTVEHNGETIEETIKPVSLSKEHDLMYDRWIDEMEDMTDSLSEGKVGYVHIKGMNDGSYREVYDKVMGKNADKEALVVDTRFNGGGWLHNDLNTFLSGDQYLTFHPQGDTTKGGEPVDRWTKPSAVVMSEGNYSDAFIFPYIYKQNDIGKLVGMPVAGTGTAVWWETQIDPTLVFGIPMISTFGDEDRPTENMQLEPDIKQPLPYKKALHGEDTQLEAAVKELLNEAKENDEDED